MIKRKAAMGSQPLESDSKLEDCAGDVLICAYAADPGIPSEPTIGWAFVKSALAAIKGQNIKVLLITNTRSADSMRVWAAEEGIGTSLEVIGVGLSKGLRWLEKPRINLLARMEYLLWYVRASRVVKRLSRDRHISLAHHVTFATEMLPTPVVHAGPNALKVWGPIGSDGSAQVFSIEPQVSGTRREFFIQRVRNGLSHVTAPFLARKVDLVITSQDGQLSKTLSKAGVRSFAFPNLILPTALTDDIRKRRSSARRKIGNRAGQITIMCVGHIIPRKRFELAIAILSEPGLEAATVHFFGNPTGGSLVEHHELADRLGVTERVFFHGTVPRVEVLDFMASADVLFHPAGREGAVGVLGEATTAGIPVVCFEDTGAALVLRAAHGNGVVIDAKTKPSLAEIASAVSTAASMERGASADWSMARFDALERMLVEHATGCKSSQGQEPDVVKIPDELAGLKGLLT